MSGFTVIVAWAIIWIIINWEPDAENSAGAARQTKDDTED